jgi:hypothetical protein
MITDQPMPEAMTAFEVAYRRFDFQDKPWAEGQSDRQLDWVLVCVGSYRSRYWTGEDWARDELTAKRMSKQDAASAMCMHENAEKWRFMRLVPQPIEFFDLPTMNGRLL